VWSHLSGRRRALFAGVAVLVLILGVLLAVRLAGERDAPAGDLVVLVPGYGGSQDSLRVLADRIAATGRQTRVVSLPGNGTGDLLAQVGVLEAAAGGSASVDVIGYSAGGVVARLWVARGAHPRRVITLGSPLHGTRLAATGGAVLPDACPVACQQLAPGSALLNSFARDPVPVPWLSLWTENDQTVQPPDSARLDGAINVALQALCPGVHIEHSELPTSPLTTALVLDALSQHPLSGPARCPG
jgi:triacylglycerol esterase/lipase EstA (alpha/beta hydrolase family)